MMHTLLSLTIPQWMERAACANASPDIFFPSAGESLRPARIVCMRCTVKAECLAYALDAEGDTARASRFGIYAGLSPEQRAKLQRTEGAS